ncbi:hypothetical protein EB809_09290 [Marinobacter sp. R17]|nr:hypothetical protein EB809_09290 [Marinobacter sp. R17]
MPAVGCAVQVRRVLIATLDVTIEQEAGQVKQLFENLQKAAFIKPSSKAEAGPELIRGEVGTLTIESENGSLKQGRPSGVT